MWDNNGYSVDRSIVDAIEKWFDYGLPPGSCTEYMLRGDYLEAYKHAHPLIKPYWDDHVGFVQECVPVICRGDNYDNWKGYDDYLTRKRCRELVERELNETGAFEV
jgi:hypothetical protein